MSIKLNKFTLSLFFIIVVLPGFVMPKIRLRSHPISLNDSEIVEMLKKYDFYAGDLYDDAFHKFSNTTGEFDNNYEEKNLKGDNVIIDHATDLMWSSLITQYSTRRESIRWIEELNQRQYGGFSDWRIPTIEEAASLLESKENEKKMYIDLIFPLTYMKRMIITCDVVSGKRNQYWIIDFYLGVITLSGVDWNNALAVRSIQ